MKHPAIARGIVEIQEAQEVAEEPGEGTVPDPDKVLVEMRIRRYFVYDGEEGARFEGPLWLAVGGTKKRIFVGLDEPEKHAFVQHVSGVLTPFGALELRTNMARLGWDERELARRCGVSAGAIRDAVLRTSSCTNTYPKMLAAIRLGQHAMAMLEEQKAKAAA